MQNSWKANVMGSQNCCIFLTFKMFLGKSVKNKFLFTMMAYPGQTRTARCAPPYGTPDAAWIWTRDCSALDCCAPQDITAAHQMTVGIHVVLMKQLKLLAWIEYSTCQSQCGDWIPRQQLRQRATIRPHTPHASLPTTKSTTVYTAGIWCSLDKVGFRCLFDSKRHFTLCLVNTVPRNYTYAFVVRKHFFCDVSYIVVLLFSITKHQNDDQPVVSKAIWADGHPQRLGLSFPESLTIKGAPTVLPFTPSSNPLDYLFQIHHRHTFS